MDEQSGGEEAKAYRIQVESGGITDEQSGGEEESGWTMDQQSRWEELRIEARKMEADLKGKLSCYSKPKPGAQQDLEMEIKSLLDKLWDVNKSMFWCARSAASTISLAQKIARHREFHYFFTQEFRQIKGNLSGRMERADLLSSLIVDISDYKMDDVKTQAETTRAALGSQRAMFGDVHGKVKQRSDKFPSVCGLIGSIRRKKSRDTLIVSAVIAACTLFLIIYALLDVKPIFGDYRLNSLLWQKVVDFKLFK